MLDVTQLNDRLEVHPHPEAQWYVINQLSKCDDMGLDEAEHILDWFEQERVGRTIKYMNVEDVRRLAEAWTTALIKKGNDIIETEDDLEVLFVTSAGSRFCKLLTKNALIREGKQMSHCVGSMQPGDIYSIRTSTNKPIATLTYEKDNSGRITQLQGKGNGPIHPKYITDTIEVLRFLDVTLDSRWMTKLGYNELADEVWEEIDRNWTNVKEVTVGGTRYFWLPGGPQLKRKG